MLADSNLWESALPPVRGRGAGGTGNAMVRSNLTK